MNNYWISGLVVLFLAGIALCFSEIPEQKDWIERGRIVQHHFVEEVPFTENLGLVFVKVNIKGRDYNFVLDTGAPNVVSVELAREMGWDKVSSALVEDSQNRKQELDLVLIDSIHLGDLTFTETAAVVVDFSTSPIFRCLEIDGFIGANLMKKAVWKVDFSNYSLSIADKASKLLGSTGVAYEVPFQTSRQGTPLIEASISGIRIRDIRVDFGSTKGLDLNEGAFVREVGLADHPKVVRAFGKTSTGIFGSATDTVEHIMLNRFALGNLEVNNIIGNLEKYTDNQIGTEFFMNFTTILDWKNNRLLLAPQKDREGDQLMSFGLAFGWAGNKLVVERLYENSPALEAGLKISDQIIRINGKDFASIGLDGYCNLSLKAFQEEQQFTITVAREGEEFDVLLEKKDLMNFQ